MDLLIKTSKYIIIMKLNCLFFSKEITICYLIVVGILITSITIGISNFSMVYSAPVIKDKNLKTVLVVHGLKNPTSMAFLGPNDILVTEKSSGEVKRIINGSIQSESLLKIPVAIKSERGLLGLDISKHRNGPTFVFLYYTKSGGGKAGDDMLDNIKPAGNFLYRYELVNNHLINPKLLLKLPATPGPNHDGGKVLIGPDNNVYVIIGDFRSHRTQAQNINAGNPVDNTSGILRVTQDGKPVPNSPFSTSLPLNLYYAYGIRNSFGITFDPLTGKIWDTENGPNYGDEINFVDKGFNSGWSQVQGIWTPKGKIGNENVGALNLSPSDKLVNFNEKGKYRQPVFIWYETVAPTALKFFNSTKLGKEYQNNLFVGDFNNGNLYDFKVNKNRTGLIVDDPYIKNNISYNQKDSDLMSLGGGFDGGITDIKIGPKDGLLYILTLSGSIYRLSSTTIE